MIGAKLDTDNELLIQPKYDAEGKITSGVVLADVDDQCVAIVLQMQQGDLKEDPLAGAALSRFIRGKYSKSQIEQTIRQQLTRAGFDYNEYKQRIRILINNLEQ